MEERNSKEEYRRSRLIAWTISQRRCFTIYAALFTVVISFFYGLASGLLKPDSNLAHATMAIADRNLQQANEVLSEGIELPNEVEVLSMGEDVRINGKDADVVMFVTERAVKSLVSEQLQIWKRSGIEGVAKTSNKRGLAIAYNKATGARYSMLAWVVKKDARQYSTYGRPVQGILSVAHGSNNGGVVEGEENGEVPDVPLFRGGKAGALMASNDRGIITYSGAYTNPGTVSHNIEFYQGHLLTNGWREVSRFREPTGKHKGGGVIFRKEREEIVLLFNELEDETDIGKTLVTIARKPLDPVSY